VFDAIRPEEWAREQARQRMFQSVPEVRARAMQQFTDTIRLLAVAVAERAGRPADDFGARVLAGAAIGAALAAIPHEMNGAYERSDFERLDAALKLLQDGLPL